MMLLAAIAISAGLVFAVDYEWTAAEMGNWGDEHRWTPAGQPAAGDSVRVGNTNPLFVDGERTIQDLTIDLPSGFVQLIGSGRGVLNVTGTLTHQRDDRAASALRGHVNFNAGTLGLVIANLDANSGRLILGQAHEQTSRALTGFQVKNRMTIANGSSVELFTDGAVAHLKEVYFGPGAGTLILNNGTGSSRSVQIGLLQGEESGAIVCGTDSDKSNSMTTLRIGADGSNAMFAGQLRDRASGSGGGSVLMLVKQGTGTQVLAGRSDYRGATMIQQGGLIINGDHAGATGSVTVMQGAALAGNGILGGEVTVSGRLVAGVADGTLRINRGLILQPTANVAVRTAQAGTEPLLMVDGSVQLAGTLILDNHGSTREAGSELRLFDGFDAIEGTFDAIEGIEIADGLAWNTSRLYSEGVLTVERK